jgi:hypothetical protein
VSDFLADNYSAERRRDNCVATKLSQLIREPAADLSGDLSVLKEQCALEILAAVETRAQNEVAVQQRAGFAEKR